MTFLLTDSQRCNLQICTAGQYAPIHSDTLRWNKIHCHPQLPLGILAGHSYRAESFPLSGSSIWLLFSDGITEARNSAGEDYTEERFLADLPTNLNGANTFQAAVQSWKNFVGSASPHDDASLLMLDWRGQAPSPRLHLHCQTENLCQARDFVEAWAKYAGFDDIVVGQIVLACDEATTNIYRYAYDGKPGPLGIEAEVENNQLVFHLADSGTPVDPDKLQGRDLDDLRPGGLGVLLLKQIFDEVTYQPKEAGTILTLKRNIA
ncbi:MAG: SpoIIE family protein phosphatase [Blastochloris sp.]|nr:SpoIIE family protein phosphatase [Blastochloris sp.]